jgi:hypothetical protein
MFLVAVYSDVGEIRGFWLAMNVTAEHIKRLDSFESINSEQAYIPWCSDPL